MAQQKKLLLLGYGDLAAGCAALFLQDGHKVTAVARSQKRLISGLTFWQGAITEPALRRRLLGEHFDTVIVTVTPDSYDDGGYKFAYVDTARYLVELWGDPALVPKHLLFVSSTSVYGQCEGEWVDEQSDTSPVRYAGKRVLEAEHIFRSSQLVTTIVRFSGIYSKERDFLVRQVREGKGGDDNYTNRIHRDDCVAVLKHLSEMRWHSENLAPIYLASDSSPVRSKEIRSWLAKRLHIAPTSLQMSANDAGRAGNKRCDNRLLLETGYEFIYPTYESGYDFL